MKGRRSFAVLDREARSAGKILAWARFQTAENDRRVNREPRRKSRTADGRRFTQIKPDSSADYTDYADFGFEVGRALRLKAR